MLTFVCTRSGSIPASEREANVSIFKKIIVFICMCWGCYKNYTKYSGRCLQNNNKIFGEYNVMGLKGNILQTVKSAFSIS